MQLKKIFVLFTLYSWCWLTTAAAAKPVDQSDKPISKDAPLIVEFKSNEAELDPDVKAELHQALEGYWPEAGEKILVVGYTDTIGDSQKNNRLSLNRAQAVRAELIDVMGLPPASVVALGRGEQHQVASNKNAQGRSLNRRVEIYFAQIVNSQVIDRVKNRKPPVSSLEALVEEARNLVKMRRLTTAFQTLAQAKAQGGDQLSNWHAVTGIGGYYAGMPDEKVRSYLTRALQLDPYNSDARAFLGRLEARRKIALGHAPPAAGLTPEKAIAVSHVAEIYEYLRLLHIRPKHRARLPHLPIEVWNGVDESGNPGRYYFDYSRTLDWAYQLDHPAKPTALALPVAGPSTVALPSPPAPSVSKELSKAETAISRRIWESGIYR